MELKERNLSGVSRGVLILANMFKHLKHSKLKTITKVSYTHIHTDAHAHNIYGIEH